MVADVHTGFPRVLQIVAADKVQRLLIQVRPGGELPSHRRRKSRMGTTVEWHRDEDVARRHGGGRCRVDDRWIRSAQQWDRVGADAGLGGLVVRSVASVWTIQHRIGTVDAVLLQGFLRYGADEGADVGRTNQHAPVQNVQTDGKDDGHHTRMHILQCDHTEEPADRVDRLKKQPKLDGPLEIGKVLNVGRHARRRQLRQRQLPQIDPGVVIFQRFLDAAEAVSLTCSSLLRQRNDRLAILHHLIGVLLAAFLLQFQLWIAVTSVGQVNRG